MHRFVLKASVLLLTSMYCWSAPQKSEDRADMVGHEGAIFATVGDTVITRLEFEQIYQQATRQKFYHGKPSEKEQETFRRQTAEELIDRTLLLQEAGRRGIQPDEAKISATLDSYRKRYANSQRWQRDGSKMLAALEKKLREDQLLQEFKTRFIQPNQPSDAELREFYQNNLDKFTEPGTQRVSLILLKVDPSSPREAWENARTEAEKLIARINKGEKFSALANEYSADLTAQKGGDMGYLHKGMLGQAAEETIDQLSIGDISSPVRVLEGMAIFRLEDRKKSRIRSLADVRARATALWQREKNEADWQALKQRLRETTDIKIYSAVQNQGSAFYSTPEAVNA